MNILDLFLEMIEGMKELVEHSRAWYEGTPEDNVMFTNVLNKYIAEYLAGVADLVGKGGVDEEKSN